MIKNITYSPDYCTQQVNEQDKSPPNQTTEEEIGNLPDQEFQIMIVKMIQNLENKM